VKGIREARQVTHAASDSGRAVSVAGPPFHFLPTPLAAPQPPAELEPLAGRLAGAPDAIGGGAIEHVQGSLLATGAAKRPAPGPEH